MAFGASARTYLCVYIPLLWRGGDASDGSLCVYDTGIFPIGGVRFLLVMLEIYALQLNAAAAMLAYYICSPFNMAVFPLFM